MKATRHAHGLPPTNVQTQSAAAATTTKGSVAARLVLGAFDTIDVSHNGRISERELDAAIQNPTITGDLADAVVTLRTKLLSDPAEGAAAVYANYGLGILQRDWENISGLARFALRKRAVSAADLERWAKGSDAKLTDALNRRFELIQTRRIQTANAVFAAEGPSPAHVHQGWVGDCVFDATAACLAKQRPDDLRKLFTHSASGAHVVRLNGKEIEVAPLTDGETGYHASSGAGGQWLALAAKAYGQLRAADNPFAKPGDSLNAGDGAAINYAIRVLTGHGSSTYLPLLTSTSKLRERIIRALDAHRVIVAGAFFDTDSIHRGHAYGVLSYDRATDVVTVLNPYGENKGLSGPGVHADGTVTMTMDTFASTFHSVAIEKLG